MVYQRNSATRIHDCTVFARNWKDQTEVADLRQETYVKVYEAASQGKAFIRESLSFSDHAQPDNRQLRRSSIVQFEIIADVDALGIASNEPSPEHYAADRQQIRTLQTALDSLPPRCREVVIHRKIDGLSQREISKKMGITENTVERHL